MCININKNENKLVFKYNSKKYDNNIANSKYINIS